ncbi:methionine--tRNA ligase, mitochondrial [Plutella xylostella]|uniref:methionine--tRNA ligase, mitochondrial n=1 Tax=Plutella xylostella TaxID=51655 RepID=UPI002032A4BA|nr:methionine--tRNA ligase, mitochondrial [Plutella xylostella]
MRLNIRLLAAVKQNFFITTPIFYVNAAPHIGHLYTALVADAVQRFEKLVHPDINVVFTTGTDEHGTKIQQAAAKANLPLPEYCTKISQEYKDLFKEYNIGYTDFVRTTEERHKTAVRHFWNKLKEDDYIYKASYAGWYSVNDEAFVPDAQVKDQNRDGEMVKVSLESGHTVEWTEETNYMFRLSAFKTHLQRWLKTDGLITPHKFQKQLQDMVAGDAYLPDISVSRPSSRVHWAIRVPDDDTQSIYVWLDALVNYLTVGGYPRPPAPLHPPDLHVLGKDILKFHGIYWPAFLMAIKWHPPRAILCHGHWTVDGAKMSKSLHNVVSPRDSEVGSEGLRYFLLSEHTLHSDANYSTTKLINTVNASLADTLGNLMSRCSGPALNPRGELPPPPPAAPAAARPLIDAVTELPEKCHHFYSNYQFYKAVDSVIEVLHMANLYFEEQKPWELRKRIECQKDLDDILHITMETLRVCGIILQPIIPELSTKLLDKLSVPKDERTWEHCEKMSWLETGAIREMRHIQSGKFVLFQRVYTDKDKKTAKEKKANV